MNKASGGKPSGISGNHHLIILPNVILDTCLPSTRTKWKAELGGLESNEVLKNKNNFKKMLI